MNTEPNITHLVDPDWIPSLTEFLTRCVKNLILECREREDYQMACLDLDSMQIRSYGTLKVWELALQQRPEEEEQGSWTFFLFTQEDLNEGFGHELMDILMASWWGLNPHEFDSFAPRGGRQDLYVFPSAAKRFARAIPESQMRVAQVVHC